MFIDINIINLARFVCTCIIMFAASLYDMKYRRVPGDLWNILIVFGIIFNILSFNPEMFNIMDLVISFLGIVFIIIISWVLLRLVAFGGAEANALVALQVMYPLNPSLYSLPYTHVMPLFALTVFMNTLFISFPFGIKHPYTRDEIKADIMKGIPFIIFLFGGYIVGILYGDIILSIMTTLTTAINL